MTEQAHLVTCRPWADPSVSVLDDLRALRVSLQQEATQPFDDHGLRLAMDVCERSGGHQWQTGAKGILGDWAETEQLCATCPAQRFYRHHCFSPDRYPDVWTDPQPRGAPVS